MLRFLYLQNMLSLDLKESLIKLVIRPFYLKIDSYLMHHNLSFPPSASPSSPSASPLCQIDSLSNLISLLNRNFLSGKIYFEFHFKTTFENAENHGQIKKKNKIMKKFSFHLCGLKRIDSWKEKQPFKENFGIFSVCSFGRKSARMLKQ